MSVIKLKSGREMNLVKEIHELPKVRKHAAGILLPGWDQFPPIIHSTVLKDMAKCKAYVFWKHICGVVRSGEYSSALHVGQVMHSIVYDLYRGLSQQRAVENTLKAYSSGGVPSTDFQDSRNLDLWKGIAIGILFAKTYPVDTTQYEIVDAEATVTIRMVPKTQRNAGVSLPVIRSPIRGTLDLVLRDRKTGELWIVDHKTTSGKPREVASAMDWDVQAGVYRLLAMARYPDDKVAGFIFNIVQKPTIQFCGKDRNVDENGKPYGDPVLENYLKRLEEWYADKWDNKSAEEAPMLSHRAYFSSALPQTDLFAVMAEADKLLQTRVTSVGWIEKFPRCGNYLTCSSWMGRTSCPYIPLCAATGYPTWQKIELERGYIQSHRDFNNPEESEEQ